MELQALLVLCGVGVVGIAVVLLMGLFSASGTSYEEAIAQQRKAATELLALAENKNKPKKNKKATKKLAKKEKKEINSAATGSEPESEAPAESGIDEDTIPAPKPHVEFSPPVIVDVSRDTVPNVKIRKRGKDPKVKPILINKDDPSCVSDPSTPPSPTGSNHFEEIHPKDDFELLQSSLAAEKSEKKEEVVEKKEIKPPKQAKSNKTVAKQSAPPAPEVTKEEVSRERHNSGDVPKEQRKAKKLDKRSVSEEVVEPSKEEVIEPVPVTQPTELTTDKLLKQAQAPVNTAVSAPPAASSGGKNKKKKAEPNVLSLMAGDSSGVNVGELVRVVREAVLSRTEIQILTDALLNKQHDTLPEHSEWTEGPNDPMQKLKKQLADKEKQLADEMEASQALHAKLKELRSNLNAEKSRASAVRSAAEQASSAARAELHTLQARLQRLMEENHALAQEKQNILQSKLDVEVEAQAQRVQMEMHIQQLTESEVALLQQISALQAELNARVVEVGQVRCDAVAARESMMMAQQHAVEVAQQLQEANRACSELEQHRAAAAHGEQIAQQELRQAQDKLAELQNEVQRLASRAQTAESNAEKLKEEGEKQKHLLSTELATHKEETTELTTLREEAATLRQQLCLLETELSELKQMKTAPAQNGLPPAAINDQHKAAELAKVESVVESLRNELISAQNSVRDQQDQVTRLQEQLQQYQDKNNDLRTKNWKVMEALQSAEKALQSKSGSALPAQDSVREAIAAAEKSQYNEIVNVLRVVCPSAAPSVAAGKDWVHKFADNIKRELVKPVATVSTSTPVQDTSRIDELTAENEHLSGLVDKYKTVIHDTEGVLSRLQQNVSAEEHKWALQLEEKQKELDELRQRTLIQMQNKIDSLQAELQQAKSANHNHSFADAERLTQERLMSATDKFKVVIRNGPLQMGLEEK